MALVRREPGAAREQRGWTYGWQKCLNCGAVHMAVFPVGTVQPMQCHKCEEMACYDHPDPPQERE